MEIRLGRRGGSRRPCLYLISIDSSDNLVMQALNNIDHMLDIWDLVNRRNLQITLMKHIMCFKCWVKWRLGGRMRSTCGIREARRSCRGLDSLWEQRSDFGSARSLCKVAMRGLLTYLVCIKFSPARCISFAVVVPCSKEHHLSPCVDAY
jgi:hypothetical protein